MARSRYVDFYRADSWLYLKEPYLKEPYLQELDPRHGSLTSVAQVPGVARRHPGLCMLMYKQSSERSGSFLVGAGMLFAG